MAILKTYWLPILVTLIAGVAAFFFPIPWLASVLVLVVGCVWGLTAPRQIGERMETAKAEVESLDASIRESVCTIVDRVNLFIDEEVKSLNDSLQQIESLAKDAVVTLSQTLTSLNHQVRAQSQLLTQLAGISAGEPGAAVAQEGDDEDEGAPSWGQYVDDSRSVIEYFLRLLEEVSNQRQEVAKGLKELSTQAGRTRDALDTLPPGVSKDLRMSVAKLRAQAQRQIKLIDESPSLARERDDATRAISRMEKARTQLQEMRDVVVMNVEAFEKQSSQDVGRAVRSLQFEDIVTQLVAGAKGRLEEMNRLVGDLTSRVEYLKLVEVEEEPIGALRVVQEINQDVVTYTEKLRASRTSPVGQSSLDEGSIELF
ncbi:MAG: hypothetical protein R3200_04480 [Xanthomonadales bacterium]|nr:hypothetical protein [Xanthomonadales bacterium]